ncbi:MAG: glycosyltransferase family 4 protein [candidate division Zixibacteria bacterium]|nr:glycosyltransferase family 4 protein [candidate division Zixibacteria bacterium]
MKIGIKATQIVEGGGLKHLDRFLECFPENEDSRIVVFLSDRQRNFDLPDRDDVTYRYSRWAGEGTLRRIFWEQVSLRHHLRRENIDVLFEPGNFGMISKRIPRVVLVHSLAPFSRDFIAGEPLLSRLRLHLLRIMTKLSTRKAKGVIHLTEFARSYVSDDLQLGAVPQRIVYMGIDREPGRIINRSDLDQRFNVTGKLIFSCSHIYRYKNILELIKAFRLLRDRLDEPLTLVLAGEQYDKNYTEEIRAYIEDNSLEANVRLAGSLCSVTVQSLYAACDLFVFPSQLESASLILLEAMQMGAPIAASDTSLCREVLEDSAVYFDPKNPQSIYETMARVLEDGNLCSVLRSASRSRAESFSWKKTAEETYRFICEVADLSESCSHSAEADQEHEQTKAYVTIPTEGLHLRNRVGNRR